MQSAAQTDNRSYARLLYFQGWRVSAIARELGLDNQKIYNWKRTDKWDKANVCRKAEDAAFYRLNQLLVKPKKTNGEFKEMDLLLRAMERFARINKYTASGKEADLNPKIKARNATLKKKPLKNYLNKKDVKQINKAFNKGLFEYQNLWLKNIGQRTRNILKSRQIGATWYFAREAANHGIATLNNKIFLSASKNQALMFHRYLIDFIAEVTDKELKGGVDTPLQINTDDGRVYFYFLGTSSRTAQGYHGDIYMDEYFWIPRFAEFNKVASGMAMHKKWHKTYISTPSALSHEAYPFWAGKRRNLELDLTSQGLKHGRLDADRQWRHLLNIEDAMDQGCNLFDLDELRDEYSDDEFANLLMCQFIDDKDSVFPLSQIQGAGVDVWELWDDFKPFTTRPYGDNGVWVGYDPSPIKDNASVVVVAPPRGKFKYRCLEKHSWQGLDYAAQAGQIKAITKRYKVDHIGIDKTGTGEGVYQIVKGFYPRAQGINYSIDVKNRLVMRLKHLIAKSQISWDSSWTDLMQSLMSIHQVLTPSGNNLTYKSGRNAEIGHADLAWALMHALEPLSLAGENRRKSTLEIM